jgi:molecular chaperone GrpE (heat shock protein)
MEAREKTMADVTALLRENTAQTCTGEDIKARAIQALDEMAAIECEVCSSERNELGRWKRQKKQWMKCWNAISVELKPLISRVKAIVASLEADGRIDLARAELQDLLRNRKDGLDIISRMLERLPQRQTQLSVGQTPGYPALQSIARSLRARRASLGAAVEPDEVRSETVKLMEEIEQEESRVRDENYDLIREARLEADRLKRAVTGFVKDHLLPAVDGIERGLWDEGSLREPILSHEGEQDLIDQWFGAYRHCYRFMKRFCKRIGLVQLEVRRGMDFDPEWHTALGTATSIDFQNGQVQELLRSGWRLCRSTIRPAEVLVVRN